MQHTTAPPSPLISEENAISSVVVFDKVLFAFDEHVVLSDISFSVPKGGMKILLGASGVGKSVVLKLILGLLRPDAGTILVNGQRVDRMTERDLMHTWCPTSSPTTCSTSIPPWSRRRSKTRVNRNAKTVEVRRRIDALLEALHEAGARGR